MQNLIHLAILPKRIYIYIYMKFHKLFLIFFLLIFFHVRGQQAYPIHDTAFLHFLNDSVPNCVRNDSLIIDSAHLCTKNICNDGVFSSPYYYDIHDIDGLQFFDHTHYIAFGYTHIASLPHLVSDSLNLLSIAFAPIHTLPPLDSLPNLNSLNFEFDSLIFLPDLNHLKNLENIYVVGSSLDSLPSLDSLMFLYEMSIAETYTPLHHLPSLLNNKMLNSLEVYYCGLDSLPDLDSCIELFDIDVSGNNLTKLPSLSNNKRLIFIFSHHNSLTQLPSLSDNTELEYLYLSNNLIDTLPDLSQNVKISVIYLDSNRLKKLPSLTNLTSLKLLHASSNKLLTVPVFSPYSVVDLDLSHNMLTGFPIPNVNSYNWLLNDNRIRALPDFYPPDSFDVVDISQNILDFSDAYNMKQIDERTAYEISLNNTPTCCGGIYSTAANYAYSPQKPFGNIDTIVTDTYSDTILTIADQQYADSYQWYQNGVAISGAVDTILHIYCATQADAGTYTCHSIGQYFNTHDFRFNYDVTEFLSEPQTLIVSQNIAKSTLAALYPAVSSGNITLKYSLPESQSVVLQVYDLKGSLVYDQNFGTQAHSEYIQPLNLSGLASGSYIARIGYGLGYKQTIRFVILK